MKSVPLRPKYPLEQYVIAFEFPGTLTSQPVVTVDLVTGDDPNFDEFAGWLFTTDNVVSILVARGIAGCVYRVTCDCFVGVDEFTRSGVIAVNSTVAIVPPGFSNPGTPELPAPVIPFGRAVSSPIYPAFFSDRLAFMLAPVAGELITIYKSAVVKSDRVEFTFAPVSGEIYSTAPPVLKPDKIEFTFIPVAGNIQSPAKGTIKPDKIEFTFIPSTGNIQTTPRGTIKPDKVEFTFIPVGGTIS